jgi:two-component system NtrC family sensor kinase
MMHMNQRFDIYGMGIPQKVSDKIYQPFFTTKPPGQGTGLGLSLSYDIIKAHGG